MIRTRIAKGLSKLQEEESGLSIGRLSNKGIHRVECCEGTRASSLCHEARFDQLLCRCSESEEVAEPQNRVSGCVTRMKA